MKFFIVLSAILAVANCGTLASLNSLVEAENLVPAHLDVIQTRAGDNFALLGQLRNLLADSASAHQIYSNYVSAYSKESSLTRAQIFAQNLIEIAEHNVEYHMGNESWFMGVNHFTDMTGEELMAQYTGLNLPMAEPTLQSDLFEPSSEDPTDEPTTTEETTTEDTTTEDTTTEDTTTEDTTTTEEPTTTTRRTTTKSPRDSKDWRKDGVVTCVKNQKNCGSCVTFATNAVVESAMLRKGDRKSPEPDLSEQELVDCTTGNNGCNGGWYTYSFDYIQQNGLSSERAYQYTARDGKCRASKTARTISPSKLQWTDAQPRGSDESLKATVANDGLTAVAVGVTDSWYKYKGGIYRGPCTSRVNHAVTLVGYGSDSRGPFWIVKNSWDKSWGEQGYIRLDRRQRNFCQVASHGFTASF